MAQVSRFLRSTKVGFIHYCPACDEAHHYVTDGSRGWAFNGNVECPTFTPSMLIRTGPRPTVPAGRPDAGQVDVCHYVLTDGQINFCGDCTHGMVGQTVPLPELPEWMQSDRYGDGNP